MSPDKTGDTNKMNATVNTTTVTQTANELLGKKETTLYYLIIDTPKGKLTINVGEKTHNQVKVLTADDVELANKRQAEIEDKQAKGGKK